MSDRLHIEMFGGLRVEASGRAAVELPRNHASALLAYLAMNPQRAHLREELTDLFWPDDAGEESRNKLRKALHGLRSQLEHLGINPDTVLTTSRASLQLKPAAVATDLAVFEEALAAAAQSDAPADRVRFLALAAGLYRGELLSGFYQDFFIAEQNRMAEAYQGLLTDLSRAYEQIGELDRALEIARRAVTQNPLNEETHCDLMRLYAAKGQPSAVLRQYQELERALREHLDESPSESTRNLRESLRDAGRSHVAQREAVMERLQPVAAGTSVPGVRGQTRRVPIVAALFILLLGFATWRAASRSGTIPLRSASVKTTVPRNNISPYTPSVQPFWFRTIPVSEGDKGSEATDVTTDRDRNIYVTGFVDTSNRDVDYVTLKYAPDGTLLWQRRYNGLGNDVDRARSIAVDSHGNVIVTGESDNGLGNNKTRLSGVDIATVKYDPNGKELFKVRWNGLENGEDWGRKVVVDKYDNIYVAGNTWSADSKAGGTGTDFVTLKYGPNTVTGSPPDWVRRLDGGQCGDDSITDMIVDPDGGVYVTGYSTNPAVTGANEETLTVKYGTDGETKWINREGGVCYGGHRMRKLVRYNKDLFVVAPGFRNEPAGHKVHDLQTSSLDPASGRLIWSRRSGYDKTADNFPRALACNQNRIVAASEFSLEPGGSPNLYAVSYNGQGNEHWQAQFIGAGDRDIPESVQLDAYDNTVIAGRTTTGQWPRVCPQALTVMLGPDGSLKWISRFEPEPDHGAVLQAMTLASDGAPIVAGYARIESRRQSALLIMKYRP